MFARIARMALATAALAGAIPVAAHTPVERSVIDEINFARTRPQEYAQQLRRYRQMFDGNVVNLPGDPVGIETNEGVAAVDEAIAFLERQAPLPPVNEADLLGLAASDHVAEQGPSGEVGHDSPDGSEPGDRVVRRGGEDYVAETIAYGSSRPADVVRDLIVDDGEADRGHREVIFTAEYRYAGVGCGKHAEYREMCVVDWGRNPDGRY